MPYVSGTLAGVIILMGIALWINDKRLDSAREELATVKADIQTAVDANETMKVSLLTCQKINKHNAEQRDIAEQNAAKAHERITELEIELAGFIHTPVVKTDENCRKLDEPLPTGFINQLCIDRADNCNQN